MTTNEINEYIRVRNNELCMDEILHIIDISRNPQINGVEFHGNEWKVWTEDGDFFVFRKRNW